MTCLHAMGRRRTRGGALLFGVLLLLSLAFAVLAVDRQRRAADALAERHEAEGRLLAAWFLAAHRAAQEGDWRDAVARGGAGLSAAGLAAMGAVPPGLRADGRIALGVIDDGHGVAMAFAVLEGAAAAAQVRAGALAGGLRRLDDAASPSAPMARHRPAIEAVLGRPLAAGALMATADHALAWRNEILHRRPQPGRPWLNRMDSPLDAGSFDIGGAVRLDAAGFTGRGAGVAGSASVSGSAGAATLAGGAAFTAGTLEAPGLVVRRELAVGTLRALGAVRAAGAAVRGGLQSAGLASRTLFAQGLAAGSGLTAGGGAAFRDAAAGRLVLGSGATADRLAAGGLYGPALAVTGALAVDVCEGC